MGVQFPGKKRYVTLEWPLTLFVVGLVYHLLETNEAYVYLPSDFLKKFKHPYDVHLPSGKF